MSKSEYAIRMGRLSKRIFGDVITKTSKKSMKVVRLLEGLPAHKNPNYVNYYPPLREITRLMEDLRKEGLYRCEFHDMKQLMSERRKAKGIEERNAYKEHLEKQGNKETKQFD